MTVSSATRNRHALAYVYFEGQVLAAGRDETDDVQFRPGASPRTSPSCREPTRADVMWTSFH